MSSEEPSKPSGRRWRRSLVVAGLALILVVTALASALLYREELAQAVLRDQLNELGLKEARFRVEQFTTDTLTIAAFSAGTSVSFDRLTVGYSVKEILRGHVARIGLTGLTVDMTQPGPWSGLRRKQDDKSDTGAGLPFNPSILPIINIRQARFRIDGPAGPMMIMATAHLRPNPNGTLAFQAKASTAGPAGEIEMDYDGTIRVGADGGATAAGRLSATSASLAAGETLVKSLRIELPLSLTATTEGGSLTGQMSATATSLTVGNAAFRSPKIELPLSVDLTTKGVTVIVSNNARFETSRVDLDSGLGSGPTGFSLSGRLTSTLSSGGWFDANADIAVDSKNILAGDVAAGRVTGALALRIKAGPESATIDIARNGRVVLDGVRTAKNNPVTKLSALLWGKIALSWPADSPGTGLSIDHKLSIVPAPVTLPGSPDIQAVLGKIETSGTLAADGAYKGRVAMDTGRLSRGSQSVAITRLMTRLDTQAGLAEPRARLTIGTVRDMSMATVSGAPVSGTYDLTATVRQSGKGLSYQANIGGLGIKKLAAITGSHNLTTGAGHADVSLPDVALGSDGVQPGSVIPALNTIRDVAGNIGGSAKIRWSPQGLNGRARLRLDGIGGETENGRVEGLSGTIALDRLIPPSTAPGQLLRIRKIDAGAVLTDTSIRFALLPSGILRIDRAEATLADGKIIIEAPAIDLVREKAKAKVTFEGVQLEQLLDLADLGDLQASGRIHGFVPIRVADGKIAINAGALASLGGGVLRFKSERAKQVLKSGGDQVALMLQALEDFSYERLGVDIDKSMTGSARVTLRTLGHNPAVLRGRKFQINVNLETNLDRLLDAALEWYSLSGRALRDIVAPRTRKGTR